MDKYMMATKAYHPKSDSDLSRCEPQLCRVSDENDDHYIGSWVTGMGFIEVWFPKATTRELTAEEEAKRKRSRLELNGVILPLEPEM